MDSGNVAELDTPLNLYDQENGIFRGMCERSGIRREDFFLSEEARFAAIVKGEALFGAGRYIHRMRQQLPPEPAACTGAELDMSATTCGR